MMMMMMMTSDMRYCLVFQYKQKCDAIRRNVSEFCSKLLDIASNLFLFFIYAHFHVHTDSYIIQVPMYTHRKTLAHIHTWHNTEFHYNPKCPVIL